jgi:diacylglycerol kinase (ATP)
VTGGSGLGAGDLIAAIVNPAAGSGAAGRRWPAVERMLAARGGPIRTFFTKGPGHATELARELADADVLVVAGGDGTLNEVVNGAPRRIAVMPLASGGDFARTIGVRSVNAGVEAIASGQWQRVDVFRARFGGSERLFLNTAGFGMAGTVARDAPRFRVFGAQRYLAAAIPSLASGASYAVSVMVDNGPAMPFEITTAAVCNGQYEGGGIRIAPEASLDDGLVDVTVVETVSLFEVTRRLPILYNGALYGHPRVRHWRGQRVRVEGSAPLELDGESVGRLPLEVEWAGSVEVAVSGRGRVA